MKKNLVSLVLLLGALMLPAAVHAQNIYGDVNGDLEVNIADINSVIDIILGGYGFTVAADVNGDGEINIADVNVIINIILESEAVIDEHKYVDLGLPSGTLWATCNIGAIAPEEYGDYFAWGETEPKEDYTRGNYKWYNSGLYTKYCINSNYGTVDGKTELDLEDDAAFVNWGAEWRMPSREQMQELIQYCTWRWTTLNGVNGHLVTGSNGNTIFMPAAGSCSYGTFDFVGSWGHCWSRTLCSERNYNAHPLNFNSEGVLHTLDGNRCEGNSVRPVRARQGLYIVQKNLDLGEVGIGKTCTGKLTIINNTAEDKTLTVTADAPFSLKYDENSASILIIVVPSKSAVSITVMFNATTPGEFNGNVTFQNPVLEGGQSVISVHAYAISYDEYVDLGLPSGTLWATCDIGASCPEDYGDYFAWGETEPKDVYTWETYKWCNGSDDTLTKYCTDSEYGMVDNKTILDPQDDAAFVNLGPEWRMPTEEQMEEVSRYCSRIRAERNGVIGYLITGPNGNSIFLPGTGEWANGGYRGSYWSCSGKNYYAFGMEGGSGSLNWVYFYGFRCVGHTVRAVRASSADFYVVEQSLDLGVEPVGKPHTGNLTIVNNTIEEMTVTATIDEPFLLKQEEDYVSSMDIVVPGCSSTPLIVVFNGTTSGQYNGNVTIKSAAPDGVEAVIPVKIIAYADVSAQQEYLDLGLPSGTLWATCNLGADAPEEYGDYFAWGETEPKDYYDWSTYKWCNGSEKTLTKYCTSSEYGTVDNKTKLDLEDDAAFVNLGPEWRMPTKEQIWELELYCTWRWTTVNGVEGELVIGSNGNTLFLPLTGERCDSSLEDLDWYGYYWSRELNSYSNTDIAEGMGFNYNQQWVGGFGTRRCYGCVVRAVRIPQD